MRLADGREVLAEQLVAAYKADEPDVVSLVIRAHDFADLIEQFELAKRVHERNGEIVARVHAARDETHRQAIMLAELEVERRDHRRGGGAPPRRARQHARRLGERQATLARVRAARAQALAGTRAGRSAAEKALNQLIAERERPRARRPAAPARAGRGRSRGRSCSASRAARTCRPTAPARPATTRCCPSTWKGLGGSTPHAYQASKAEQDRLAAQLWAGGAGARNWVCAGLV